MTLLTMPRGRTPGWAVPLLYEDEVTEMGDSDQHTFTINLVELGLEQHFRSTQRRVYRNLNTYYTPPEPPDPKVSARRPCVASDLMAAESDLPPDEHPTSYDLDLEATPDVVVEALSEGTAEDVDLVSKPVVYAFLQIPEYILIDTSGKFLPERLLLKRLQPDGTWLDLQDPDGGITSELGFRILFDDDGILRVTDLNGKRYYRPKEVGILGFNLERTTNDAELAKARAESAEAKAQRARADVEQAEAKAEQARVEAEQAKAKAEQAEAKAALEKSKAESTQTENEHLRAQIEMANELRRQLEAEMAKLRNQLRQP